MNKVFRAALSGAALLLLISCSSVYAEGSLFGHGEEDEVLTKVIIGTSGYVSGVSNKNRILGYTITGTANAIAGIYDFKGFITEGGCLANDMKTVFFPFPRAINGKLEVLVNAVTTIVTIYYE